MSGRYLCAAGMDAGARICPAPADLPLVFEGIGVAVWASGPVVDLGKRGCIVGHLFTRTRPSKRVEQLYEAEIDKVAASGGRSLVSDYWGGYAAVLVGAGGRVTILRDPSGAMPCFVRKRERCLFASNDAWLVSTCDGMRPRVDFTEVARLLHAFDSTGAKTCLSNVVELIAGQAATCSADREQIDTLWTPWNFVKRTNVRDQDELAALLGDTISDCVSAWAGCFESILLGVSGGLDSSVVAAALPREGPELRLLSLVGPDADGDETGYACQIAEQVGVDLAVRHYDLAHVDIGRAALPHLPWPVASYFSQSIEAIHQALETESHAAAHFTGSGGDNVFCNFRSSLPLLDRWIAEGLRPGLLRTLIDISDLTEIDVPTILRIAWRRYRRSVRGHRIVGDPSGLSDATLMMLGDSFVPHPWLAAAADASPGKAHHVAYLMRAQKSIEMYRRGAAPPQIAPLVSQPVIELSLTIPTWDWIAGGINRAPVRRAFQAQLPPAILHRRSKGGPGGFMHQIYEVHAGAIDELLRDGMLVANGIIDPAYLSAPQNVSGYDQARELRLLSFAAAETWVRWWCEATPAKA